MEIPHFETAKTFDYKPRPRLVFGNDSVERVGELAREYGARKVLLVTDPGIVKAGHLEKVRGILEQAGLATAVFQDVIENPTTRTVSECVSVAQREKNDFFIALGGGSSMDTAKGCNFILTNGGKVQDYWGVAKATK